MGCSIQDQITGYKAINKKLKELNPKVDATRLQFAINDHWLGLNTIMNDAEKAVYKKLVQQTEGLARIGLGGNKQLNEGLVIVKEVDGEYTVYLESGKNYTFAKGKVKSKDTAKGQSVTMPTMVLTDPVQMQDGFLNRGVEERTNEEVKKSEVRRLAAKIRDTRVDKVENDRGWKRYAKENEHKPGKYNEYFGSLEKVITKLTNPKIVTDVVGLMFRDVFNEGNVIAGEYDPKTHTVRVAKQPTTKELDDAAETALMREFTNIYNDAAEEMLTKLKPFLNNNKKIALEEVLKAVETVNGSSALTHELIHAGSKNFMDNNPKHPAVMRIKELYQEALAEQEEILSMQGDRSTASRRWLENEQEFVAEALSNPQLMYALSKIKTVGKEKLSKGLFAELVETLVSMLGLSKKVEDNLLQFTMDGFTAIMEAQAAQVKGGTDSNALLQQMKKLTAETKGSDENTGIGETEVDEFLGQEELNLGTVLADEFANYYGLDAAEGNQIQTQEFADLQNTVVKTYQETMQELGTGNVKLRMFENMKDNTAGQIDLRTKEMHIRWNKMSRLTRVSEVFLHEINHLMSSHVFKNNIKLKRLMEDLRNSAIDSGATYELFLEGIENPTAEEIQLAKNKFEYTFDKTANIEEFYAYATTNEQVYNALKDVKITTPLLKMLEMDSTKKQPFKKVMNILIKIVNDLWRTMSGRGDTGGQMIADMIQTIAKVDVDTTKKKWTDEGAPEGVSDYAKVKMNQLDEAIAPVIKKVEDWQEKISEKGPKNVVNQIRKIPILNDLMDTGIGQYLWRAVTQDTTTQNVADMYMVFRHSKQAVEKHTADIRNGVKGVANELYKDLDERTKDSITRVILEGDLAQFSAEELKNYMADGSKIDAEIAKLEKEVYNSEHLTPNALKREQIDGLADYLVTGKTSVHNQQVNANNIAANMMGATPGKPNKAMVANIDKLVSLKVLQKSDKAQLELLDRVDNEVLQKTINMYRAYIDNMREDAVVGANDPIPKGYTRPADGLLRYELVRANEVEAQESIRMTLVNKEPYAIVEGQKYYLMVGKVKSVGFSEGAIGLISHTTEGIPISSLIRKNNENSGNNGLVDGELRRKTKNIINAVNTKENGVGNKFKLGAGQTLIPVYDHQNKIVDYRIQLNKLEKAEYLPDRKTELGDVMSHTFSRSVKTSLTATENKKVIDTIIENSARGVLEEPDNYVLIEEYTEEDKINGVKREKRHDRWEYLPDHTKDYIFKKTRNKGILIHKDFVELMTGEKDVTIGNFAKFGIDIKKYPIARARLMALEAYVSEILSYVKQAMVVLNADVLLGNQTSNALVAMTHGIDPITYTKKFKERWQQLNDYNEKMQQLAELEVRQMAGEKVDVKIRQLKKQLEGNIWDELVKDGQYTALVEDINIDSQNDGQIAQAIQDKIDGSKFKELVNTAKNIAYIDKTSALYGTMLKTVHYGDAITRQIIKEELEAKAIKKHGELTKDIEREILNYLDQLLVNYGYTMNRWWKYAERVGGLFFMKYYTAQAKAIASMTKKNPTKTALMQGAQYVTGVDFKDPIDTYTNTGLDGISYRWMFDDAPGEWMWPNILDLIPDVSNIFIVR